jgi:hypothetical protein
MDSHPVPSNESAPRRARPRTATTFISSLSIRDLLQEASSSSWVRFRLAWVGSALVLVALGVKRAVTLCTQRAVGSAGRRRARAEYSELRPRTEETFQAQGLSQAGATRYLLPLHVANTAEPDVSA